MIKPILSAPHRREARITINAPSELAWEVLRDFYNVTWAPGVSESHGHSRNAPGLGEGRHCRIDGLGEIDETILQWEEGIGYVYNVTPLGPLVNGHSSWWVEPKGNKACTLNMIFNYDLRFGILGSMMHTLIMRKKLDSTLLETAKALRNRVENRAKAQRALEAVA